MVYSLTWLADVLRAAGLRVVETQGWQSRGHGDVDQIQGVLCHHTAGPRSVGNIGLDVLVKGRPDLAGPLCNLGLARDGTVYVVAAGKAWHAGAGLWHGISNGNARMIGIEAENTGRSDDPWPAVQMDAYARAVAAILQHVGQPAIMCAGHREYALPKGRKPDPSFDMDKFRASVQSVMSGRAAPRGDDPPPAVVSAAPTNDQRTRMGRVILGYEARVDRAGNLMVYQLPASDEGGSYEVGGINVRFNPVEAAHLRELVQAGRHQEAKSYATEFILRNTAKAATWTTQPGVEFLLRSAIFNRGQIGAAKILQIALGVDPDGDVGPETRKALAAIGPSALLTKLRAAREYYELHFVGYRAEFWSGLKNRWDKELADARKFATEGPTQSQVAAKQAGAAGAATAGTATVAVGAQQGWDWTTWLAVGVGVTVLVVVIVLAARWLRRRRRVVGSVPDVVSSSLIPDAGVVDDSRTTPLLDDAARRLAEQPRD